MITPNDIENKQFRRAGKGYAPDEVDDFLDQLTVDYEKLYRTTREQAAQIDTLNQAVAYYQGLEDSLNKALVLAEKTAAERKAAAEERAAQIEQDATRRGEAILADAKGRIFALQQEISRLEMQHEKMHTRVRMLLEAELDLLDGFSLHGEEAEEKAE